MSGYGAFEGVCILHYRETRLTRPTRLKCQHALVLTQEPEALTRSQVRCGHAQTLAVGPLIAPEQYDSEALAILPGDPKLLVAVLHCRNGQRHGPGAFREPQTEPRPQAAAVGPDPVTERQIHGNLAGNRVESRIGAVDGGSHLPLQIRQMQA